MVYERLAELDRISSSLCIAIEVEVDISDLLFEGRTCLDREVLSCYQEAERISFELTDVEKLVVAGVGKKLWRDRVENSSQPDKHPEYSENMNQEVEATLLVIEQIPDDTFRNAARQIINNVDLPVALGAA